MEGTFAVWARMFADTLSPRAAITGAVGPMNCAEKDNKQPPQEHVMYPLLEGNIALLSDKVVVPLQ
jgi:hypothetical protein